MIVSFAFSQWILQISAGCLLKHPRFAAFEGLWGPGPPRCRLGSEKMERVSTPETDSKQQEGTLFQVILETSFYRFPLILLYVYLKMFPSDSFFAKEYSLGWLDDLVPGCPNRPGTTLLLGTCLVCRFMKMRVRITILLCMRKI